MTSAFCTHCGAALNGARFCTTCGASAADGAAETVISPARSAADAAETLVAGAGAETEMKPRGAGPVPQPAPLPQVTTPLSPIAGLPPLPAVTPLMPVAQPRTRKSPWPWIAVGAVLAVAAGAGTAYALWPKNNVQNPTAGSSVSPTTSSLPTVTATAVVTQTVTTAPAGASMSDGDAASTMTSLLNEETKLHKPWDTAIGNIRLMCNGQRGNEKPIPFNQSQLDAWTASVQNFGQQRRALAGQLDPVISQTAGQAHGLAVRLQTIWSALAGVDDQFATWATNADQTCQSFSQPEPTATGDATIATRAAWLKDFGPFAGNPQIVTDLLSAGGGGL